MMDLRVIVDQRERNTVLLSRLEEIGVSVEVRTLPVADYIISDRVAIERKSLHDFERSIIDGRLFEQLAMMSEHYASPMVILEGEPNEFRLDSSVISGAVAHIYIEYGAGILISYSSENTADIIKSIAKYEQQGARREPSMKGGNRAYTGSQFQEYVVGNLPGVGPKLARSLLRHFGSVSSIVAASVSELTEVEKIGKIKAERIYDILHSKYIPSSD